MHAVVMDSLEEYLAGALEPATLRQIDAHLSSCRMCREEVGSMRDVAQFFGSFRLEDTGSLEIAPGFYGRVMNQVSQAKPAPAFFGFFDLAFGRRLVFACLLTLAVLGGYLVTHETQYPVGPSPEAILAQQNSPAFDTAQAEDNMLVTLTAYEH